MSVLRKFFVYHNGYVFFLRLAAEINLLNMCFYPHLFIHIRCCMGLIFKLVIGPLKTVFHYDTVEVENGLYMRKNETRLTYV